MREKVAKTAAAERAAELLATFEKQLASVYSIDTNEVWGAANAAAGRTLDVANATIAEECARLGIPAPGALRRNGSSR
jgi:hypothetical protein